ncbi:MAG: cytochrome b/b6 domain-containing protein [Gammaproteobacteria bacterium]|nr:cytochrome b/b6 domain-containing protein [Gammaproteobacteria bacterium]
MQHNTQQIKVWDPLVRFFHWSLVLAFMIAYITEEDFLTLHSYAGYAVLGLILVRIVWGLIGTRHARFRDFIYPPETIKQFIKDTMTLKARRYLGHNPAGGAMILLMIVSLIITSVSGIAVYGAEEQLGPMAGWFSHGFWGEALEELHEFFANFTLLLVFIHISGVIIESLIHKENLVKSMVTGMKQADSNKQASGESK